MRYLAQARKFSKAQCDEEHMLALATSQLWNAFVTLKYRLLVFFKLTPRQRNLHPSPVATTAELLERIKANMRVARERTPGQ